jgi:hypothetical protein
MISLSSVKNSSAIVLFRDKQAIASFPASLSKSIIDLDDAITLCEVVEFEDKNILDLQVGDIVQYNGARFEIIAANNYLRNPNSLLSAYTGWNEDVMNAIGQWIDGDIIKGYFGPFQNFTFQGNKNRFLQVEI